MIPSPAPAALIPEDDVPSPCIKVCTLDPESTECLGCGRTIDEIAGWRRFTPAQKRAVLDRIAGGR